MKRKYHKCKGPTIILLRFTPPKSTQHSITPQITNGIKIRFVFFLKKQGKNHNVRTF